MKFLQFVIDKKREEFLLNISGKFLELKDNYTIVVVTHILRQARRIADHVIFMYMGEVIEQGPAKNVFENPQMEKTKQYLSGAFY